MTPDDPNGIAAETSVPATAGAAGSSAPASPGPTMGAESPLAALRIGRPIDSIRLRHLQWIGIGLPIAFLVAIEAFRFLVVETDPTRRAEHVAIAAIVGVAVVGFAVFMFSLIERAERQIVRRNRELTAINAVSTAVQGELGVSHIIDAALSAVIERTGATEASVVVFPHEGREDGGLERRVVVGPHASVSALGVDVPHLIDIPLMQGPSVVGRMRLHLPEGTAEPDLLTSATLHNIGHQLASAIQIGQLVADLQRRRAEGHGLYDVLIRISNQRPLGDTLAAIAGHARDLVHVDEAVICLNPATSTQLQLDGPLPGTTTLADGTMCISANDERFADLAEHPLACRIARPEAGHATTQVVLASPDGPLGELWVSRGGDRPFNGRERGYLAALAELGAIAIANARMRESERQAAILAERDRIAREMHDSLAQVLGVTHLRLRALLSKVAPFESPAVESELRELGDLTEEAYRDVREAILGLRESSRVDRGLFESLRAFLERYSHQSGLHATLESALDHEPSLAPRVEIQVIRVIQEALTNVRKHASATSAVVRVDERDGMLRFSVEDDGRGFDLAETLLERDAGFGLHTMRERMELVGGTLTVDAGRGRGTRVVARVPDLSKATPPLEVNGAQHGAEPDRRRPVGADPHPARR